MTDTTASAAGSWRELLGRDYLGATIVLAGGVAIYAINEFITISLLPSVVADIGGERFYAWVTTVYLVASVMAATTVGPVLTRFGPRVAYLGALLSFAAGSALCALAPTMQLLLAGRVAQGLAGGVLAGLGYAVISAALPDRLWTRASAVVSAMWGVGTLVGPATGGLFAQFAFWRGGFGSLAVLAAAMSLLVPVALPTRAETDGGSSGSRIPVRSLMLLGLAALAVSAAVIPRSAAAIAGLLALGVALVLVFIVVDRRVSAAVLPRKVFEPGPLKWIYLTLGVLMMATMVDMYVPLFGQRLAGLAPVVAGFLGAVLSVGWTVGEITSASIGSGRVIVRVVAVAPLVMAAGLALAAFTQTDRAPAGVVVLWVLALVITGSGIGMAWPHLSAWAMGAVVGDPGQQAVAAAAINTVQLMCGAFGAGLAGVVVNLRAAPDATGSTLMFGVFAVLAAVGCVASYRSGRGQAR
ncbi:MFS transporter [Mycobacterium sp. CVI_P3]|uniref:MFS transporter n=1 Tax=Mycobacterium pinniadriaticum TaxID=2994102 RepID=A0ABT3SKL6_9MYCO|nr:MFS transporter [Mycobacterium pinniadriaticum]MCX2932913.1 MFS transporter [Mycobacterium pinniadriaticum]MCX2939415.1 MFS transporter [Mycobacterium pinniadriaticum]